MADQEAQTETVIAVKNVSKYFAPSKGQRSIKQAVTSIFKDKEALQKGGYWALRDINFEIKKGEFFAIVGRNGSGKSTLLKMIAGIYSATEGEIGVNGKIVPFIELGVGFNMDLSGRDNVFLNGALLGFDRKEMTAMYNEIVEFAELKEHMDVKLKNFSSGMQVRLAFSIAIRAKSDILLIDEVLAVGDAAFQQKCFSYFEELKRQKKTVVFVSHDMASVRRFCSNAVYIDKGRITHEGTSFDVAEVYAEENIQKADEAPAGTKLSDDHKIKAKIADQTDTELTLKVNYTSNDNSEMYVGISILKDGVSLAEITTALDKTFRGSGNLTYTLDTTIFNGGAYYIAVALFRLENRELIAIGKGKSGFAVKGFDITKGAAFKLPDTWQYK